MPRGQLERRRWYAISSILGLVLVFCGLTMLVPSAIALLARGSDLHALLLAAAFAVGLGLGLQAPTLWRREEISQNDAVLIVVLCWAGVSVLGALPFLFSGLLGPADALFESISGFTTTGASVIADVEAVPHGLLFWRSLTHWLGGMGILVLAIAVLPFLRSVGYRLLRTEAPALEHEHPYPRMVQTARALFSVYTLLTAAEVVLLVLSKVPLFDAITTAFGTIATGGFSPLNRSIGEYDSLSVEVIVMLFMFMSSVPFGLHHRALRHPRGYLESIQLRTHAVLLCCACLAVMLDLWRHEIYASLGESLRQGAFQVTSLMTTTGFATADSNTWPPLSKLVLLVVMFIGGCTGSTAGAIKTYRILVVAKMIARQVFFFVHPRAIRRIWIGRQAIEERLVQSAAVFFMAYLIVALCGTAALVLLGSDDLTAISATAATLGGVGPGLAKVGPLDNYSWMPAASKGVCMLLMLLGRLEIFTLLAVFFPGFWHKR